MNRQQFNKYLAGHGLPNRVNLSKITSYFGVDEIVMVRSPDIFIEEMSKLRKVEHPRAVVESRTIEHAVADILEESRNTTLPEGCYDFYFPWYMDQSKIVRSVVIIFKDKQRLCFRRYTRLLGVTADLKNYPSSRHDGIITSGGRGVHMLGRNQRGHGEISLVSIGASRPRKPKVWFGLALIMTPVSEPVSTRCTLVHRGDHRMFRSLLKNASRGGLQDLMRCKLKSTTLSSPTLTRRLPRSSRNASADCCALISDGSDYLSTGKPATPEVRMSSEVEGKQHWDKFYTQSKDAKRYLVRFK